MIAIVDYGMGNVRSLSNALDYIGCEALVTSSHDAIREAERLILPGVGAFGDAMIALRERGLDRVLDQEVRAGGKPLLGICLGMQLLATRSVEHGRHEGLGWFDASIERFSLPPGFKIPHIGWNAIDFVQREPFFAGLSNLDFYFVHSFHMCCRRDADVIATSDHGGGFTAAVARDNIVGMQFHPEKSQDNGVRVLQNFVRWSP